MPILIEKHCRMAPAPEDGTRILVMRRWPRGVRKDRFHTWDRHLGPSETLLNSFLGLLDSLPESSEVGPGNPAWDGLMARYVEEMRDQGPPPPKTPAGPMTPTCDSFSPGG